jgi:hypothetical protein
VAISTMAYEIAAIVTLDIPRLFDKLRDRATELGTRDSGAPYPAVIVRRADTKVCPYQRSLSADCSCIQVLTLVHWAGLVPIPHTNILPIRCKIINQE